MALSRITNPFLSSSGSNTTSITSPAANTIAFTTTTTERMRINSSGNFTVGKTDITTSVDGFAVLNTGETRISCSANDVLNLNRNTSNGAIQRFFRSGSLVGQIEGSTTGLTYTGINGLTFTASQTASSDANTLDDYEEGTWTPTITSSSGTITSYTSTGFYVKIGKQVTVWCNVKVTNVGTGTGSVSISSMPFTVNATDLFGIVAFGRETDITGVIWQGWSTSGGNGFNVLTAANGGLIGTNYRYVGSVTYTV